MNGFCLVPAKSKGQPIGQFKVGQKIAIQYVSGEWAFGGPKRTSLFSPDNKPSNVELVSPSGNTHGLPVGTKQKSFMYSVVENGVHKLCMADVLHSDNRGEVVYSISLVK